MSVWDFVVAGAGPAGSHAAELFAGRGASVLLLDPKAPWEKPCGGGLSAGALRHTPDLAELRSEWETITEVLVVAPNGASVVLPLSQSFAVVSRLTLSRWGLARATEAGARFVPQAVRSVERVGGTWRITDGRGEVHQARWLLGADGAASRLRGWLAPRLRPELAPTRVGYPTGGVPSGLAVLLLFPRSQGYLWDFPRPGLHSVGIALGPGTFRRDTLDRVITEYLGGPWVDDQPLPYRGAAIPTRKWHSGRFRDLGSGEYALLGDAAGLADPLTGEGIDYALRSATLAAQTFDEHRGFRRYPRAVGRAFRSDGLRGSVLRQFIYRPAVVNHLVQGARRPGIARDTLCALMDAVNEHRSLADVARRIVTPGSADGRRGIRTLGSRETAPLRVPGPG